MKSAQRDDQATQLHDAWLAGYEAAVADAVQIVDGLGGPAFSNLSAPVLVRLKSRFLQVSADSASRAA